MADIWEGSRELLLERVEAVEDLAAGLMGGQPDPEQRRDAEREAHKLAGSLGTFGFSDACDRAREVEWMLQGTQPLDRPSVLRLTELAVQLRRDVTTGRVAVEEPGGSTPDQTGDGAAPVLFVDPDVDAGHRLVERAAVQGISALSVVSVAAGRAAVAREEPSLVVMDPTGDLEEGAALMAHLADRSIPVVVVATPGGGMDRATAARLGSEGYLEKPLPPATVVEVVARVLARRRDTSTVLVVDDDPSVLELVRAILEAEGCRVEVLSDPIGFWSTLEHVHPDLCLLDFELGDLGGAELCRMVRNDLAWAGLPVMFLSAHTGAEQRRRMFTAGADDVIAKPVAPEDLVVRVRSRLERSRARRDLPEVDPRTGLAGQGAFRAEASRLLELARRHDRPAIVAAVGLDRLRTVEDDHGREGADVLLVGLANLLRRSTRPEDALGMADASVLALVIFGQDLASARRRMERVVEAFRSEEVHLADLRLRGTCSVGLAAMPEHGTDWEVLYPAAQAARRQALADGGDGVGLPPGGQDAEPEMVDVVLVDDDEAFGALIVHFLSTQGYTTRWITDGSRVAGLLTGDGALVARIILLDVGLPGIDGMAVLRQLAAEGVLARTRVIMVSLRSGEDDVLAALELGAFDHVAKPLSVPVLLHRIRRAMDSLPG